MLKKSLFDGGGYYSFRDWLSYPLACGFSHRRFEFLASHQFWTRTCKRGMRKELSLGALRSFKRLLAIEEVNLVIPHQTQSAHIEVVDETNRFTNLCCDGLITKVKTIALAVLSADCSPIFFYDKPNQIIGIAHVGWRGLKDHLPEKIVGVIRRLGKPKPSSIRVGIGPTIRGCCYEIGREQEILFLRHIDYRDGRRFLDLAGATIEQLIRSGVKKEEIVDSYICPSCENDRFFSWRRERTEGRTMSVIMMR